MEKKDHIQLLINYEKKNREITCKIDDFRQFNKSNVIFDARSIVLGMNIKFCGLQGQMIIIVLI